MWTGEVWPEEGPEEDEGAAAVEKHGFRGVVVEAAGAVAVGVGQNGPQLHAVEGGGLLGGDLGVADAGAGGHEVDLTGQHDGVLVAGIVVGDGTREEPRHRLQAGVRVRGDVHAAGEGDVIRAVMVDEAPGADEAALALGEGAVDGHGTWAAEGNLAGGDDLDPGAIGAVRGSGGEDLLDGETVSHGHEFTLQHMMLTCLQKAAGRPG